MTQPSPTHNQPEYSVSEVSGALKRVVEDTFGYVRVRGEISGFKQAASGHLYLDLKDEKAVLNAVCWKGNASKMTFRPEDGLEVIVTGKITTYPGRSNYQIVIDKMEPAGEGALMALLEKRKRELAAEGLFAAERKKQRPFLPETIGVVTSPTGSVIRDILHRISERFPRHVLVWPVRVQGAGAEHEIAAAIRGFSAMENKPDLLIVARGGGSLEDLWCFNEEVVVRAVADCPIPLISAVGHETDTTLIDYVADLRAPTPTAAAELAVPVREEWLLAMRNQQQRLDASTLRLLGQRRDAIAGLARGLPRPDQLLAIALQRIDGLSERLGTSLPQLTTRLEEKLRGLSERLTPRSILDKATRAEEQLAAYSERASRAYAQRLERAGARIAQANALLESLNYKKVLERGFAIVRSKDGELLTRKATAEQHSEYAITFADGVLQTSGNAAPKPKAKAKKTSGDQESLF